MNFAKYYSVLTLVFQGECVVLRDRKLNIAPAIKKQPVCPTNGAVYYAAAPQTPISNIPMDQFAAAVYPPGKFYYNGFK